jgi:hypothetical protein
MFVISSFFRNVTFALRTKKFLLAVTIKLFLELKKYLKKLRPSFRITIKFPTAAFCSVLYTVQCTYSVHWALIFGL